MYAVTGITGKVGTAVARSLLSADQLVRAVVRDRGKGAAWADLGCDIAVADLVDAGALAKAFEGTEGVFAMLQEHWEGRRVVELEGTQRVSPNALADAFAKVLAQPVRAEAVPHDRWESIFRAQGMKNPTPRIQMIDGFNAGWIDFPNRGANARKGCISIDQAIATMIQRALA